MASIPRGAASPEAYELTITQGASGLDLSTVSAVSLKIRRNTGSGGESTWSTALSAQTSTSLKATHTFAADGSDVPEKDTLEVEAFLTTPGGTRRADRTKLHVT